MSISPNFNNNEQENRYSSHYQLIRELGRNREGGRITYLATNTRTQQPVVIKRFLFTLAGASWTGFKAYEREIQVLKGLNHPGIPRYLNCFDVLSGFCMVQEYKDAQPLSVPRTFDSDEVKQIAVSILEILVYLQNRIPLVIHRDIKPENILVDEQLNVYLVDFGFARIGGGEVAVSSVAAGTFGFMPLEQMFKRHLNEATDLYGLGATLICLLTGTKSTAIDTLIDDDGRIAFKPMVPNLSLRFIEWLEKMVQPKQKDRYPNATAALEALKPIYVIRIPEVQLSHFRLVFQAKRLGEKLTETIVVSNSIPETVLEGTWEVAPHPSDPPHAPDSHAWISFHPAKLASNRTECRIAVDPCKLMSDKIYERTILLQTNSDKRTHSLVVKVLTAPVPIENKNIPYDYLALTLVLVFSITLFLLATELPYLLIFLMAFAYSFIYKIIYMRGSKKAFCNLKGFIYGGVISFFSSSIIFWQTKTVALVAGIAGMLSALLIIGLISKSLKQKFSTSFALATSLITALLGIDLGILYLIKSLNPLLISFTVVNGIVLVTMIVHPYWQRWCLMTKYRQSEQHLIKP